jgi:hypothetical protein
MIGILGIDWNIGHSFEDRLDDWAMALIGVLKYWALIGVLKIDWCMTYYVLVVL